MVNLPAEFALMAEEEPRLLKSAIVRAQAKRLAMRGLNAKQAAEVLNVSAHTVQKIYQDPTFRSNVLGEVEEVFGQVDAGFAAKKRSMMERIEEAADKSFEILFDLLQDGTTEVPVKVKIAQDFMNRHPESTSIHKSQGRVEHTFSAEDLAIAAQTAAEMNSKVIDIRRAG